MSKRSHSKCLLRRPSCECEVAPKRELIQCRPRYSALNDAVAIVHIPVSLCPIYTTQLYWTIYNAPTESAEFFNVTSNRIEASCPFKGQFEAAIDSF